MFKKIGLRLNNLLPAVGEFEQFSLKKLPYYFRTTFIVL